MVQTTSRDATSGGENRSSQVFTYLWVAVLVVTTNSALATRDGMERRVGGWLVMEACVDVGVGAAVEMGEDW